MTGLVPPFKYTVPLLNHNKQVPYIDFPLVYNETVTNRPFYVEYPFTFVTSSPSTTSLYKWTGAGWAQITPISNPENVDARGFFSVTTSGNAYVAITEHVK